MRRGNIIGLILAMALAVSGCGARSVQPAEGTAKTEAAAQTAGSAAGTAGSTEKSAENDAQTAGSAEKSAENDAQTAVSDAKADFPVTITDQAGRSVTIESEPKTIVSGYYISSSILIALGISDRLTGIEAKAAKRPIYSLAAPALLDLPNVGTAKAFDLEGCAALKPELVILPKKLKDAAASLDALGLKTILVDPENTEALEKAIGIIAAATGTADRGRSLVDTMRAMQASLEKQTAGTERPSVYLSGNASFLETAGSKMYQSAMIENAGGRNAASGIDDTYWTAVSYEQLLEWDPEYIVIAAEAGYSVEDVLADANLSGCRAVKNGNVYAMPCEIEAWDSPVPGGILGSIWLAGILHEDKVDKNYYENAVRDFYGTFYALKE